MFKVLVIEEETPLREAYCDDLKRDGYQVVSTDSTREGLDLVENTSPDAVILDAANHDMDCLEAVGRLLAHCPRIPVVLSADPHTRVHVFLGRVADAAIPRTSDTKVLRSQLRRLLVPDNI